MISEERTFTVPGTPQGKGRPRATSFNGHARVYTPNKTAAYENLVVLAYSAKYGKSPRFEGSVSVVIKAFFPYVQSDYWPKNKNHDGELREEALSKKMLKKPDIDNVAKAVLDGLNQAGVWADDSQVTYLQCHKDYCTSPHLFVSVEGEV